MKAVSSILVDALYVVKDNRQAVRIYKDSTVPSRSTPAVIEEIFAEHVVVSSIGEAGDWDGLEIIQLSDIWLVEENLARPLAEDSRLRNPLYRKDGYQTLDAFLLAVVKERLSVSIVTCHPEYCNGFLVEFDDDYFEILKYDHYLAEFDGTSVVRRSDAMAISIARPTENRCLRLIFEETHSVPPFNRSFELPPSTASADEIPEVSLRDRYFNESMHSLTPIEIRLGQENDEDSFVGIVEALFDDSLLVTEVEDEDQPPVIKLVSLDAVSVVARNTKWVSEAHAGRDSSSGKFSRGVLRELRSANEFLGYLKQTKEPFDISSGEETGIGILLNYDSDYLVIAGTENVTIESCAQMAYKRSSIRVLGTNSELFRRRIRLAYPNG